MRKLLVVLLVACGMAITAGASAPPAKAYYRGNVWVIYNNSFCWGSVVAIYWGVDWFSSGPPGGDWGDNVIYPSVRIGGWNTISAQLWCKRPWWAGGGIYIGPAVQRSFYASYPGQNIWLSP